MTAPKYPRSAGVLLHPTSLPGPFGIGDLGPQAYRWIDTLAAAKQSWWQVLPLGPTGFGDSPYQSFSAFAGNVNLLSPELLERDGLLPPDFFAGHHFPHHHVEYERVAAAKAAMLAAAWKRFQGSKTHHAEFDRYREKQKEWLPDYALFTAVRDSLNGAALIEWPAAILRRTPATLRKLEKEFAPQLDLIAFGQFLFDRQWSAVKMYAREKGVRIIGDAPIFVAGDSADVWAKADLFLFDADGRPSVVAGVPPDYFSAEGQLWGNPVYDWARMAETGFAWWLARLRHQLTQVDVVRLDHFRGFAAAWHVPTGDPNAIHGRWVPGPGGALFDALKDDLGRLPFIAEDLGLITPDVGELRLRFGLPGMRVLHFALGGADNLYWPHNYDPNTVAYTGTHDNDTTNGWYAKLSDADRYTLGELVGHDVREPNWELIRMAWGSVAALAVAPLQDVLGLGSEARMNTPGVGEGNWRWRFTPDQFRGGAIDRLADLTARYNRAPKPLSV